MRHRPPQLRDVGVVHQPDAGAARAARQRREVRQVGDDAAEGAGRGGGAAAPRSDWRQADQADEGAGRLSRRAGRRAVQAGPLPLLVGGWWLVVRSAFGWTSPVRLKPDTTYPGSWESEVGSWGRP